ncbi:MAG: HlyD family type I secretion periplasmic adaptor subunit [Pseudomonadota bacterium]
MPADKGSVNPSGNPALKTSGQFVILSGFAIFILLFVAGGAWAMLANLSGAVIATGQVAVLGKPKIIQHLDGGIVAEIAVDNGHRVAKDDILIKLDDTLLTANSNIYKNRLLEAVAQRSRLVAERDDLAHVLWNDEVLPLFGMTISVEARQGQEKLFDARRATRDGQVSQLREQINQYQNQKKGINALNSSRDAQLGFLEEELTGVRSLNQQGLSPKSQLMALERQREEIIGLIAEQHAELARIQNSISEAEIQILQIGREFRQNVLTELRQAEQEVNEMTQQLHATYKQLERIDIKAPVAGIVHELSVYTIGGVIGPGNPVLQIIPQDEGFEIEANVEPQFVDEIHPGQSATLRFSAFNQRTTPELKGYVKGVSADVVVDEQTGLTFYKIRLGVSENELSRLNDQPLIPGMPVEVFIKTRERTAFNYLTKPLIDQINRAFREE